jgi:hypothetical protein
LGCPFLFLLFSVSSDSGSLTRVEVVDCCACQVRKSSSRQTNQREREREERKSSISTRFRFKHFWERGVGDGRHTLQRRNSLDFTKSPFCNLQVTTIVKQFSFKQVFCFFFVVCVCVCVCFFFSFSSSTSFL